jgi:hypothetical protein
MRVLDAGIYMTMTMTMMDDDVRSYRTGGQDIKPGYDITQQTQSLTPLTPDTIFMLMTRMTLFHK